MEKLLIICGPTATGKTDLALKIAETIPADLISADSRQVYSGADIVTGKDIPSEFTKQNNVYTNGKINMYGLDIVDPSSQYNVSDWQQYAIEKLSHIHKQHRLPIVVGGTGLYIKSLITNMPTIHIPPNLELRKQLEGMSAAVLFEKLEIIDTKKANSLNNSDRQNPRRLIRAIEVSESGSVSSHQIVEYDTKIVGLTCSTRHGAERIAKRVRARIEAGAKQEYDSLCQKGWGQYLHKIAAGYAFIDRPDLWQNAEVQQFRRQKTWFNKMENIHTYNVEESDWQNKVMTEIQEWYSKINP